MTIFRLFRSYRPMAFFSILSGILVVIAAILFIPVLVEYIHTGLVLKFPTLIVSGFAFIAAIQSMFGGLILDNIMQKNRQDFEFKLQQVSYQKKVRGENRQVY